MKRFLEWFRLKKFIDAKNHQPPLVSEGDLWWASVGQNVGHEIDGKSDKFSRPVVIHTKLSNETFLVIPTSTQKKHGSWYIWFGSEENRMAACLQQARVIDYRRFFSKIGSLSASDFRSVAEGFNRLYRK